jgi:DNA-binding LytR/AlgR family response regulator
MRCLIIDDEFSARSRLKRLLIAHPDIDVVGEAEDGVQGLELIASTRPDLIFLDIEMPQLDGFQMLKAIPSCDILPLIVFVTGFDEHALAAFETDALAYLLKPIDEHRLATSIGRARQLVNDPISSKAEGRRVADMVRRTSSRLDHVVGRRQGRFVLLRPSEILFFSVDSGIVKAHTASGVIQVETTLNELEECLSAQRFFRAHRATLVNLAHVLEIEPYFRSSYILIMKDVTHSQIQVSERQAKLLREKVPGL